MDLVLVMLEFLLQARQLLVGELSRGLGLLDSESCDPSVIPRERKLNEGWGGANLVPQFIQPGIFKGVALLGVVVLQRVVFH